MNLDELQSVQARERQTDSLQQLRESFYADAGEFIQQLRDERDQAAERADDPFDAPEVNRLTDDIKTAEQTVEAIYERRVGKIVKMASLAAADMPTEEEGLTREERELFETLVGAIESNRDHVLDVLAGEASPGSVTGGSDSAAGSNPTPGPSEPAESSPAENAAQNPVADPGDATAADEGGEIDAADVMGAGPESAGSDTDQVPPPPPEASGTEEPEPPAPESGPDGDAPDEAGPENESSVDRTTVRITDDVGEIFGVDQREYDLSTDDVVTLPEENALPLVERDAAERLE